MATTEDETYALLDAYLAGEGGDLDVADEDLGPATDADQANRYLRARGGLLGRRRSVEAVAEAEIGRIRAFRDDVVSGIERRVKRLDVLLEGWMRAVNAEDPRRKTEKLPNGELKLRSQPFSSEVVDGDALAVWLWANRPDLLDVKFPPRLGAAKDEVLAYERAKAAADKAAKQGKPAAGLPGGLRLGPVVSTDEGVEWYAVVTADGVEVPGLRLSKPTDDKFSVTS